MKRKDADYSLTLEWASVWLQNTGDPDRAILSDIYSNSWINHMTLMQSATLVTEQIMPKRRFPEHTHKNASLKTGDIGRLSALLKISMLLCTLVTLT
jgi:hypothetical protein